MKKLKMTELIKACDIDKRNKELALDISRYYENQDIVVVGALKGCIYFLSDLTRLIKNNLSIEFVNISSYRGTQRGDITFDSKLDFSIKDKSILIIEDIVDTGNTVNFLFNKLNEKKPKEIKIVSFLFKPTVYKFNVDIDWVGFEIDNEFVVGYGLDYDGKFRNKNSIFKID